MLRWRDPGNIRDKGGRRGWGGVGVRAPGSRTRWGPCARSPRAARRAGWSPTSTCPGAWRFARGRFRWPASAYRSSQSLTTRERRWQLVFLELLVKLLHVCLFEYLLARECRRVAQAPRRERLPTCVSHSSYSLDHFMLPLFVCQGPLWRPAVCPLLFAYAVH